MEDQKLQEVTVLERFDLGGKTYAPGAARVPADKVETLQKKNLIARDETVEGEQLSGTALEGELLAVLQQHVGETGQNEGALDALKRLIGERDEARAAFEGIDTGYRQLADERNGLLAQLETLRGAQTPVAPNSDKVTPVEAKELTEVTGSAKAALSLTNAGFTTREKIAAASDAELIALEDVGEKSVEKLRDAFKA